MVARLRLTFSRSQLLIILSSQFLIPLAAHAQNSMVGDGFGGRLWYRPTNYGVGSYSAFTLCYSDPCDSANNQLYGWGANGNGELGNGLLGNGSETPLAVPGMDSVRYYTTGYLMGVIKYDGTGWTWGGNVNLNPVQVITDAYHVDAGSINLSFVKTDGTVWSIGNNIVGAFGDGTTAASYTVPKQMIGVTDAVRVACGYHTTYVLRANGTVLATGGNSQGALGDPTFPVDSLTTTPRPVIGLTNVVDIKAISGAVAALDAQGRVFAWGAGGFTGDGDEINDLQPTQVQGLVNIVAISGCTDGQHFMALDANGNCFRWALYDFLAPVLYPVLLASDVIDIMAGETFAYIVKADGTLWATGASVSLDGSIWLGLPNYLYQEAQPLTQLDLSLLPNTCPVVGTSAVPGMACDGSGGTITVTHSGGAPPYQYNIGSGPQSSNVFTGLAPGPYTVTVTDANGCARTTTCTVEDGEPAPTIVPLVVNGGCFTEETGYVLPSGQITFSTGLHLDTVYSTTGCDTLYWVSLTEETPAVYLYDTLCFGQTYALPSGHLVDTAGIFVDTLTVIGACDTVFTIELAFGFDAPPTAAIFCADTTLLAGSSVQLIATGGSDYTWSPVSGLSCSDCPNPTATPQDTTVYCVSVSNNNDCLADTACLKLHVAPTCTVDDIYIPSAFSPPGEGAVIGQGSIKNDQQCVHGGACISTMTFGIYDRWGTKVFESTDPEACWDGTYNGQDLTPAVFVYHLSATLTTGEVVRKQGNITLIR